MVVDEINNEETAGVAFGKLASKFIRTKVITELDAYRFAIYAAKAGNKKSQTITSGTDVPAVLSLAVTTMRERKLTTKGLFCLSHQ